MNDRPPPWTADRRLRLVDSMDSVWLRLTPRRWRTKTLTKRREHSLVVLADQGLNHVRQ